MKKLGKELEFISHIKRDGTGTTPVEQHPAYLNEEQFDINCLSITEKTFIAHGFNSFVCRIPEKKTAEWNLQKGDIVKVENVLVELTFDGENADYISGVMVNSKSNATVNYSKNKITAHFKHTNKKWK